MFYSHLLINLQDCPLVKRREQMWSSSKIFSAMSIHSLGLASSLECISNNRQLFLQEAYCAPSSANQLNQIWDRLTYLEPQPTYSGFNWPVLAIFINFAQIVQTNSFNLINLSRNVLNAGGICSLTSSGEFVKYVTKRKKKMWLIPESWLAWLCTFADIRTQNHSQKSCLCSITLSSFNHPCVVE